MTLTTEEEQRLAEAIAHTAHWRRWGPYLSDRQWGTVREDYSQYGTAWDYFPHDQARSRAYRWGEAGLLGISDNHQRLCFAIALWNGEDSILKERLFELTGNEGNHGEDVKEYYFYLDNTPTHSYMKPLYKYLHIAFPYDQLVTENHRRDRHQPEFELLDTGVFDENRYFDVFVEYAKRSAEDVLIQITVINRGAEAKTLHLLPTLWFRNTWSWDNESEKPTLQAFHSDNNGTLIGAFHPTLGKRWLYAQVNFLLIASLQKFHHCLGEDFKVECPTGSGQLLTLWEGAVALFQWLTRIFLRNSAGDRPEDITVPPFRANICLPRQSFAYAFHDE